LGGVLAVVALLVVILGSASSASAAFPGQNGRFVFSWVHDKGFGGDVEELATSDSTAGDLQPLAECESVDCSREYGDWSPAGGRLVYIEKCGECLDVHDKLVTLSSDGSDRRVLFKVGATRYLSSPAWSPTGRRIAFIRYRYPLGLDDPTSDIYVIRRDGTHLHRITWTPRAWEDEVDWSVLNRLVFTRKPGPFAYPRRYDLFSMRPDGTGLRRLTDNTVRDTSPDWAPDGKRIAFERKREIWVMAASGADAVSLISGDSPAWAPDGTRVAYISAADGAIHTVEASGTPPFQDSLVGDPVGGDGYIWGLDWQPIVPLPVP
jgi:Tol biopolymer transport system component